MVCCKIKEKMSKIQAYVCFMYFSYRLFILGMLNFQAFVELIKEYCVAFLLKFVSIWVIANSRLYLRCIKAHQSSFLRGFNSVRRWMLWFQFPLTWIKTRAPFSKRTLSGLHAGLLWDKNGLAICAGGTKAEIIEEASVERSKAASAWCWDLLASTYIKLGISRNQSGWFSLTSWSTQFKPL